MIDARALAIEWEKAAERLEAYARQCRAEGFVQGPEGAEDAEQAARDYREAIYTLGEVMDRSERRAKTVPVVCPGCKNGVRIPPYGVWRCPHCGYVLVGRPTARS
jgi:rubrerythrin